MKQKTSKIKGMSVPSIFIWTHGFFQGHVTKTAAINQETGYISSSYITGKCKLFNEFSANRTKQLEQETKAVRVEAFELMAEEAWIRKNLEKKVNNTPSSISEKRTAGHYASHISAATKRHKEIIKRLGEIDSKIRSCEFNAKAELDATASALQNIFAIYAHGVLFRPVQNSFIPPVEYKYCFDLYQESHKEEDQQIRFILKEVFNYE